MDGISLGIQSGEFVAIVGSSGSGKSTLLHMLGGLDTPTDGTNRIEDKDISKMSADELTIFRRRKIGFVFQNYNLLPFMSVYKNIVLPIQLDGIKPDKKYVMEIIETLGLTEKCDAMPDQLSGGQQQRVALARSLATKPAIVLADEPTGNLDQKNANEVFELLLMLRREFGLTMVIVTHDISLADKTDQKLIMRDGIIVSN